MLIGLLARRDSPNRKRFTKHNSHEGKALRFGFDLSPLFERLHEIAAIAAEVLKEHEQIDYLRTKIRAAANASLTKNPKDEIALNTEVYTGRGHTILLEREKTKRRTMKLRRLQHAKSAA